MLKGKVSQFGGPKDDGVSPTEGLACYEEHEADLRLDLFYHRSENPNFGVARRLRPSSLYFAYRFPLHPRPDRKTLQNTQFLFRNPSNGRYCVAWLSDYGPAEWTKRLWDVSPGVMAALDCNTDDEIEGINVLDLKL